MSYHAEHIPDSFPACLELIMRQPTGPVQSRRLDGPGNQLRQRNERMSVKSSILVATVFPGTNLHTGLICVTL